MAISNASHAPAGAPTGGPHRNARDVSVPGTRPHAHPLEIGMDGWVASPVDPEAEAEGGRFTTRAMPRPGHVRSTRAADR